jgi:hypothetical protein
VVFYLAKRNSLLAILRRQRVRRSALNELRGLRPVIVFSSGFYQIKTHAQSQAYFDVIWFAAVQLIFASIQIIIN